MHKEIVAEGNFGLKIPTGVQGGDNLPLFVETFKAATHPKDITLWSLATGILKYSGEEKNERNPSSIYYTYRNPNNPAIKIVVDLPKKEGPIKSLFKKETQPASIVELITKADIENKEKRSAENQIRQLIYSMDKLNAKIQSVKKIIKDGIGDEMMKTYLVGLTDAKISLERLLFTINEELEKK